MIRSVLIFGGGSAGFLAALTLKRRLPELPVTSIAPPAPAPDAPVPAVESKETKT